MTTTVVVHATQIALPQHMQVSVLDEQNPQTRLRMTVFTGTATFSAPGGGNLASYEVLIPVLGLINRNGQARVALLEYAPVLFRGAVATASLASLRTTDDDTINAVDSARADLRQLDLLQPQGAQAPVNAVVLTAEVAAQRSEVNRIGYQVTVLSDQLENNVALVGDPNWPTGKYLFISPIIIVPGVPVR